MKNIEEIDLRMKIKADTMKVLRIHVKTVRLLFYLYFLIAWINGAMRRVMQLEI